MTDSADVERLRREREFFERMVARGDALSWAERAPVAPRRRELRAARLLAAAAVGGRPEAQILEIGGGTGLYTEPLASAARARVVSVDLVPAALVRARQRVPGRVELAAADASRLPFRDAHFDAVVGNAILHHLPLDTAVPELLRVLKPGGRFCFAEPNLVNPHLFLALEIPWLRRRLDATPDETAFVRWPLRRKLEALGVTVLSLEPFDFLYPLIPRRLIPLFELLGRGLERTPVVREIAGSILICAKRPEEP